jgi:hypothetical protein
LFGLGGGRLGNGTSARLATILLGPLALAAASISGISLSVQVALLSLGSLLILAAFFETEKMLTKEIVESILDTAANFMRSAGSPKVRANLMVVKNQEKILPRYYSSNFRDFERQHMWERGDGSCAGTALELGAPVLGGKESELLREDRSDVTVMAMISLPNETTRTVLSVPVFGKGGQRKVVGILNFVDDLGMNKSNLASPEVIQAVAKLAPLLGKELG